MQKKSQDFSIEQIKSLLETPTGKQLLDLLQASDGITLQQAANAAKSGNYSQAADSVRKLLTPEMESLIRKMGGK